MLSWDDFRYIKAIADTRSLNGAAQTLNVNHSTVFRRLGQIEKQLGSRLFDRGRAGYVLTPCGEEMVRLAERIGDDVTSFERKVTGQDLRPSGELRVTTNDMVLLHLLTEVLVDFRKAYPEIVLDIVVSNTMLNLSRRDADVAVRATYHPPETLSGRRVSQDRLGGVRAGKPENQVVPPSPRRAEIRLGRIRRSHRHRQGRPNGSRPTSMAPIAWSTRSTQCSALRRQWPVAPGLRCCPCFVGRSVSGLTRLTPPLPELEGELWLVTHPDLRTTARVRAFVDFCVDGGRQAAEDYGRPRLTVAVSCRAMLPRRRGSKAAATAAASCARTDGLRGPRWVKSQ